MNLTSDIVSSQIHSVNRLVIKKGNTYHFVKAIDICWIEADSNYVNIVTRDQKFLMRSTLKGLLERLDKNMFKQIHRSFVVNIEHIQKIEKTVSGELKVIMEKGDVLNMSRGYSDLIEP